MSQKKHGFVVFFVRLQKHATDVMLKTFMWYLTRNKSYLACFNVKGAAQWLYCGWSKSFLQEKLYENHSPSYYEQTVAIPFCERGKVCNSCYEILYTVPFTNGASSTIRLLHAYVTTGCFIVRLVEMGPSRILLQGRTLSLLLLSSFSLTNIQPCVWAGL